MFFAPEMGGYFLEIANFQEADSLKTPEHVPPVWYYTPFYAMLRAATFPLFGLSAKFLGFVVMISAIIIPIALPWLDRSPVKSMRYKGSISRIMLSIFVISFIYHLGYSQMVTLSGKVTHQDSPVPYVNIFLKGTTLGTSTDVNGQFIIQDIPLGTYTVFISSIGFETLSSKLSLIKPLNVVSNFQLVENLSLIHISEPTRPY